MRKWRGVAIIGSVVAVLLVACTSFPQTAPTTPPRLEQVTLQLRWYHQFQFAGYYAALEQGYYRELGLDVRIQEPTAAVPPPNPLQTVLAGEAEYGVATSDVLLAYADGAPVTVLAAIFQHSPWAIAVRTDRGIRSPHDLVGHSLIFPQGPRTAELQAMILDEGASLADIRLIETGGKFPDYLFDESIDGYSVYLPNEPFLFQQRQIDMQYLRPLTYGIDFYGDVLFTSQQEVRQHPDRVRRFREASLRGWEYALEHPEETVDTILRDYGSPKSREHLLYEAAQVTELIRPQLVQLGHMNPGRWQHIADTYARLGIMKPVSSFEDFLYEPNAATPPSSVYWGLSIFGGALTIALLIAGVLYIFNRRLRTLVQLSTKRLAKQNQALTAEIANRNQVEHELRRSEAKFRSVWENASDAMVLSDADGTVLDANQAYFDLYNLPEDAVVGHNFAVIFPEALRADANMQYKRVFALAESADGYEATIQRGDGSERIVESRTDFMNIGSAQAAMLSVVRDITERKQHEEELLRQSQLLNTVGQAVIANDQTGAITYRNAFAAAQFGWDEENVIGHNVLAVVPTPAYTESVADLITAAINGHTQTCEIVARGRGSATFPALLTASPFVTTDFVTTNTVNKGTILIVTDLSEQKRLEERLRQTQKMEALGTLAGGIAHDFNNILVPILAYAELTMLALPQESPLQRNQEQILTASNQAKNLVQQILAFSRSSGSERGPLDLHPLLKEVVHLVRVGLPPHITINLDAQSGVGYVIANPGQVHQLLMNLCTNAYQAIGDRAGRIDLALRRVDASSESLLVNQGNANADFLKLTVVDTGGGMDPETLRRIFEPFFTTKEVGKGTGLGLSVVHGIVQSMHGLIDVKSTLGEGSIFTVYLPCTDAVDAEAVNAVPNLAPGTARILLVDDNRDVLHVMTELLQTLEYSVVPQDKSPVALRYWETHQNEIDLILVDQAMPVLKGTELMAKVRAVSERVPVILMSGYSNEITAESAQKEGATAYLAKPITVHVLQSAIQEALRKEGQAKN